MIIGEITVQPMEHCLDWERPGYDYERYMPPMIPDWSRNVRANIQLSGTYEEWTQLLHVPIACPISYLTQDIELTQQVIDRLSEMKVIQEQIDEVQRIFDELNEPEENCCVHP